MSVEPPCPALRLDFDRDALVGNWRALDALSGEARAGAAVKADAYGVGAGRVTAALWEAGCRDFFVAHTSEAAPLLGLVPADAIAVLHGPTTAGCARFMRETGVRPVINTLHQASLWRQAGGGRCDVMVDTGISRLGLPMAALGEEAVRSLDVDVAHSHLASADEDVPFNRLQVERWRSACAMLPHRRASLANSAGIALGPDYHGDMTRPGLSLYGGIPRAELASVIRQVVRPMATVMQVRDLAVGEGVGYNHTFIAPAPMRVGVISIGYADGYLRAWSQGKGAMRWNGARLPVLGRVSMDMTVIDLSAAPGIAEGDWVEAEYSLPQAATASGLTQYELLTLMGTRFDRQGQDSLIA